MQIITFGRDTMHGRGFKTEKILVIHFLKTKIQRDQIIASVAAPATSQVMFSS